MEHPSMVEIESVTAPQVRFRIARMSMARRIELTRKIRDIGLRCQFLDAGDTPKEKIEAALLNQEIDRLYLEWGLLAVENLRIDGVAATPLSVIEKGPEDLCREILAAIKAECHLGGEERKN